MLSVCLWASARLKPVFVPSLAMIDGGPAQNAHPALWASFVVVGEGGKLIKVGGGFLKQRNQKSTLHGSSVKVVACLRNHRYLHPCFSGSEGVCLSA